MSTPYPKIGKFQQENLSEISDLYFYNIEGMRKVDPVSFGGRVALRRKQLGLTQKAVATAVGMKQQGVDNIEKGKVKRPRLLHELTEALATTREWLLWGEGPQKSIPHRPAEQIVNLLQGFSDERMSIVIRYLKTLSGENSEAA
jgi:transcriptional regulator with XRE-family HTH domain